MSDNPDVRELADRMAIQRAMIRYARACDTRDMDMLLSCFTPDCVTEQNGQPPQHGMEAVRTAIGAMFAAGYAATLHLMGNQEIDLDGDEAEVSTYCLVALAESPALPEASVKIRGIHYQDRFVKREGAWLISRRVHKGLWMTEGPSLVPQPMSFRS